MFKQPIKLFWIAATMLLLFNPGCNHAGKSPEPVNKTPGPLAAPAIIETIDTINAGGRDTTILLKDGEAFISGHITANKSGPVYTLPAHKGQTVTAIIKPVKSRGNVRINQIQQPDGAFDGPFGDSLSYTFKKSGNIRFIIGENLMAGDPFTGDFILHVILSEQ
jgi:hypothetical protein